MHAYELLDANGGHLEYRVTESALEVGPGAPGEQARMREIDPATLPAAPPIISATGFLDRLGADGPTLMQSPAFAFQMARLAAAGTIRLDDADVVAGMQAAVDGGAITSERAAELLAAP